MKVGFIRDMGIGDVIFSSGLMNNFMYDDVYYYTDKPDVLKLLYGDVKYATKRFIASECDLIFNLNNIYEMRPNVQPWIAYADYMNIKRTAYVYPSLLNYKKNPSGIIAMHMSYSSESRTIPRETWNEVINYLIDTGETVVTYGEGLDFTISPNSIQVFNKRGLNIVDIYKEISNCKLFIGSDSGLLHLAQAANVPSIGVFTIANPKYRIFNKLCTPVEPDPECRYCLSSINPPVTSVNCNYSKKNHCTFTVNASKIIEAIKRTLK